MNVTQVVVGHEVHEMPHGGFTMSIHGKDMSTYGLEDYTVIRHVVVNFG